MSVSSNDLLNISATLLEGPDESHLRASMGRSYYAVYHESLIVADKLQLPKPHSLDKGVHAKQIDRFRNKGKTLAKLASRLHNAKMKRFKADYQLNESVSKAECQQHLIACRALMTDLQNLGELNAS